MSGVVVKGRELSDNEVREMDARIERVMDDVAAGRPDQHHAAPMKEVDILAREEEFVAGRDRDRTYWDKVTEYHGFYWLEPEQLNQRIGPEFYVPSELAGVHDQYGRPLYNGRFHWIRPHRVGQYRSRVPGLVRKCHPSLWDMAFTVTDLLDLFQTPEAFHTWALEMKQKWEVARSRRVPR